MTREEVKAVDFFLRGGDTPIRALVIQTIDRIEMNEGTKARHTDPVVIAACTARVEAYRYTIMSAIRLQDEVDFASGQTQRKS
jgi:hypothetical protein